MPKRQQIRKKEPKGEPFYICPSCNKRQTTANEWVTAPIFYEHNLKTGESEKVDRALEEHESWTCPCGEELPYKIAQKIEKLLGW